MVGKLAQSDGTTTRRNIHFFVTNKANIWQALRAAVLKRLKSCPCLNRRCDCVWLNETKPEDSLTCSADVALGVALSDCFRETLVFFSLICFAFLALVLFSTPFGLDACTAMEKKETLWETIVTIRQNDSRRHCSTTSWCFYFFSLVFAIRSVGQPFSSTHL